MCQESSQRDMCSIIEQRQGRVHQFPWMREKNKRELILEDNIIDEMSNYLASVCRAYTVPKLEGHLFQAM